MKFKTKKGNPNEVCYGDGFFISYNPHPCVGVSGWESDDGSSETAIVTENNYFILNGDYRKEYLEIIPKGLDECIKFYNKMKQKYRSSHSTDK